MRAVMRTIPTVFVLPLLASTVACAASSTECADERCGDEPVVIDGDHDRAPVPPVADTSHVTPQKEISFKPLDAKDGKSLF